jgi:hypothetical protein
MGVRHAKPQQQNINIQSTPDPLPQPKEPPEHTITSNTVIAVQAKTEKTSKKKKIVEEKIVIHHESEEEVHCDYRENSLLEKLLLLSLAAYQCGIK